MPCSTGTPGKADDDASAFPGVPVLKCKFTGLGRIRDAEAHAVGRGAVLRGEAFGLRGPAVV